MTAPGTPDEARHAGRHAACVIVVGTGLAGLGAALALAAKNISTALVGPRLAPEGLARDTRSTALFGPSLNFLRRLGVLERLRDVPVPLSGLRLIDDTGGLLRAPEVLFEAREIGEPYFGMNIENRALLMALAEAAVESPRIHWQQATMSELAHYPDGITVSLSDGAILSGELVVGADGAQSACRSAAGIGARTRSYPQVAIATRFAHQRDHANVSTELHRRAGPLTTVPLAGNWSNLIWVETPAEAARLMELDESEFAAELETRLGVLLGAIGRVGPRAQFSISGLMADRLGAHRVALVGEAAHRLPPIGAQGLNLGLRDGAWLADLVSAAIDAGRDVGGQELLDAYDRVRRVDVATRATVVDALNRSLLADLVPVDAIRGAGLAALKAVPPLRRLFMREGMRPTGPLPSLMQPLCESPPCGSALA